MKILMVLDKEFPPDERVEKEAITLVQAGHSVSIATYTLNGREPIENKDGYTIYRRKISRLMFKSSAAILLHPFYFLYWKRYLTSLFTQERYDAIHIHDLPLAKTGYYIAQKYKCKLVCDQHEFYSNWIVRTKHYTNLCGRLILRPFSYWKPYEKKYLKRADLVITVAEPLREIYINRVGISPDKIITVPNTPSFGNFNIDKVDSEIIERYSGRFVLFYAGGFDHLRGIDFILKALARLKNEIKEIVFLLAGKENRAFDLKSLIQEYHVKDVTELAGFVPIEKLSSYVAASNVCLFVPRADNLEINNTIVTKIYQYAAMGKPIIVSEAKKMKEFVESNQIGFSVPYGNIEELCRIIKEIHGNPGIADSVKLKAVNIARDNMWEITSKPLTESYLKLISQYYA
ncbi:MAG TPA: glycosyltransferase family 4 protein [Bacteroidales bacterium]|nr:glycosyltransferase family 4 protein [Bacteroidales bacterium]